LRRQRARKSGRVYNARDVLLSSLDVLVLDCQASGATPAHGDLLALGWAFSGAAGLSPVRDHWIRPRTARGISRPVRELTGWSEACLAEASEDSDVWQRLRAELRERNGELAVVPTVIHFARFELTFLRELQARLEPGAVFPFDACCLHAIGARLYPDLPRRNIRALAGFLGHTTDLTRHVAGHVEATAFIWQALLPQLAEQAVTTWSELQTWLTDAPKAARSKRRVYPLSVERRRELPDRPGVYRFVRKNDSVLYVGKATSLKKRIAGHFSSRGPSTERGLELLSQVHDVRYTETPSILEAALLETDEIKRIDPPYNVQLRTALRQAWFATRDFRRASAQPDAEHTVGPLSSEAALIGLGAWRVLLDESADGTALQIRDDYTPGPALCAMALAVPTAFLPPMDLFRTGFQACVGELFAGARGPAAQRVTRAARDLWIARGRTEPTSGAEDAPPDQWDLARVRRRLERALVNGGLVLRRARLLRLLAGCTLGYRERGMTRPRALVIQRAEIVERLDVSLDQLPPHEALSVAERRSCFDAASYDRLRVLVTEIKRVEQEGGELALRIGRHQFQHAQVLSLLRAV
jgi:DNA polymerase III subunit epsilon